MKDNIKMMIPNIITLSRVVSFVLGFILFIDGKIVTSICLYIYGSVSDALDGYLARRWNAYTKLGSYLDAICDKFYTLSIVILSVINGNYLIIVIALLELIIAIVNYMMAKRKLDLYTERVGKFKMTFEFMLLVCSLFVIKIKYFLYLFILLFMLTVYFQVQTINAYINRMNNKKCGLEVDYNNKSTSEKFKLLLTEFKYYLLNPVRIVK